ncbi:TetR/AcrR family transcriptional regulator [Pseudonocardia endophytica]|nr:TetR/AcrR family transcriptional regulator [Pseudonocardia endophytica]
MPAAPRRRLPPEQRERQVLDAAVRVFSRGGFHDASMDAVADEAGVSKPMVYTHGGGSKEELFARCIRREGDRLLASVSGVDSGDGAADPEARLYGGLRAFFATVTSHRDGWLVLYRQARTGTFADEVQQARRRIVTRVAELLADEAVAPEAALPVASTLVGAAEGLAEWWFDGGADTGVDPDGLAAHLMSVVWPGLSALRSGQVWTPGN